MKVLQIVGYSNSGKTTLIQHLVTRCHEDNWSVGVLKSHGHPDEEKLREFISKDKDTGKHWKAGAEAAGLVSPGMFQVALQDTPPLEAFVSWYQTMGTYDCLLVEGFKMADYPKVVLLRDADDAVLLKQLTEVIAVVGPEHMDAESYRDYSVFYNLESDLLAFLTQKVREMS